jgi:hypothetical protein
MSSFSLRPANLIRIRKPPNLDPSTLIPKRRRRTPSRPQPPNLSPRPFNTNPQTQEEDAEFTLALSAFKKRLMGVEGLPIVENYTEPEAVMQQVTRDLKRCINTMYPKATRTRLLTIQRTCLLQVRFLAHVPASKMPPSALCPKSKIDEHTMVTVRIIILLTLHVHAAQYARENVHHYYLDADAAIRLSNYVAFGDRCVLNIVGPSGSGKTSLLRTFLNLYEARRAARSAPLPIKAQNPNLR